MQTIDVIVGGQRVLARTIIFLWMMSTIGFIWGAEPAIMEIGEEPGIMNMEALLRKNLVESNNTYVQILKVIYISPLEIWSNAYNGWSSDMANEIRRFTEDAPELLAAVHEWLITPLADRIKIMRLVRLDVDYLRSKIPKMFGKSLHLLRDEALNAGMDLDTVPKMEKSDVERIMSRWSDGPWKGYDPNNRDKQRAFYVMVSNLMRANALVRVEDVQTIFDGTLDDSVRRASIITMSDVAITDEMIRALPETHAIKAMYEKWPARTIDAEVAVKELSALNAYVQIFDRNSLGWMHSNRLAKYMQESPQSYVSNSSSLGSKGGTCLHMNKVVCAE